MTGRIVRKRVIPYEFVMNGSYLSDLQRGPWCAFESSSPSALLVDSSDVANTTANGRGWGNDVSITFLVPLSSEINFSWVFHHTDVLMLMASVVWLSEGRRPLGAVVMEDMEGESVMAMSPEALERLQHNLSTSFDQPTEVLQSSFEIIVASVLEHNSAIQNLTVQLAAESKKVKTLEHELAETKEELKILGYNLQGYDSDEEPPVDNPFPPMDGEEAPLINVDPRGSRPATPGAPEVIYVGNFLRACD